MCNHIFDRRTYKRGSHVPEKGPATAVAYALLMPIRSTILVKNDPFYIHDMLRFSVVRLQVLLILGT